MSGMRKILMVLITLRLLMPPGICACKWSSPAGRLLAALTHSERSIPIEEDRDDDDHDAGCPASPLAAGMGVKPPSEPLLPPGLTLDLPPLLRFQIAYSQSQTPSSFWDLGLVFWHFESSPLYLTLRTLLV